MCPVIKVNLATVGSLQGDISCRLCEYGPESTKHILLECETLDIRRRIINSELPGSEEDAGLEYKILMELMKFHRIW